MQKKIEKYKLSEWACLYPEMLLDPMAYFFTYPIILKSHLTKKSINTPKNQYISLTPIPIWRKKKIAYFPYPISYSLTPIP